MARTVDEIFRFLDNKEQLAQSFRTLALGYIVWIPVDVDVRSMELNKISKREEWISSNIAYAKKEAQKILDNLDFDFQDAMLGESDPAKREALNNAYKEKRTAVLKGIEMINAMADKTQENWRRFKQGEQISYSQQCGILNDYFSQATRGVTKEEDVKEEVSEPTEIPEENVVEEVGDERPEGTPEDLSTEESKTVLQLMNELRQANDELRKAEKALRQQRFKEFEADIAESGALYLEKSAKNKGLKDEYLKKVEELKAQYAESVEKSEGYEEALDTQILEDRATLAEGKGELHDLRKEPIIKNLEKTIKMRQRLEAKLEKAKDEGEISSIEAKLRSVKSTEKKLLDSDAGKRYTQVVDKIAEAKENITKSKDIKKDIVKGRKGLDKQLKDLINEAKTTLNKARSENLPDKSSKFMMFIGAIRAKLGIGKHKADKNVSDTMQQALSSIGSFATRVGEFSAQEAKIIGRAVERGAIGARDAVILGVQTVGKGAIAAKDAAVLGAQTVGKGAIAARDAVVSGAQTVGRGVVAAKDAAVRGVGKAGNAISEFYKDKRTKIVSGLENHIKNRIATQQQKAQDVKEKIHPETDDPEM